MVSAGLEEAATSTAVLGTASRTQPEGRGTPPGHGGVRDVYNPPPVKAGRGLKLSQGCSGKHCRNGRGHTRPPHAGRLAATPITVAVAK